MASKKTPSTPAGGVFASIKIMKATFDKYAGTDGDKTTLSKKEVGELLRKELGDDLSNKKEFEDFFKGLDSDGDNVVSFEEFVVFVAAMAKVLFELEKA